MSSSVEEGIREIIRKNFPNKAILEIEDKGVWLKHIFKIAFTDKSFVYFKLSRNDFSDVLMEANVTRLLLENGIQQPNVLKTDLSQSDMPYHYIIQEGGEGKSLRSYIMQNDEHLEQIYAAIGQYYRRFTDIKNAWAGLWDVVPNQRKYPVHPVEGMYQLEIEQGSGQKAFQEGIITQTQYERIKTLWQKYMPYLKGKPPCLVHYSPFPWTIYLAPKPEGFVVSKITALGDVLWWDSDVMAAHILYPPFYTIGDHMRNAFLAGFDKEIDYTSIYLYSLLHRLCALTGTYMEPQGSNDPKWGHKALEDVQYFLNQLT